MNKFNMQIIYDDLTNGKIIWKNLLGETTTGILTSIRGKNYMITREVLMCVFIDDITEVHKSVRDEENSEYATYTLYYRFLRIFWRNTGIIVTKKVFDSIYEEIKD